MNLTPTMAIRIARPSLDLSRIEKFYVAGLGLSILFRHDSTTKTDWSILMLGTPGAGWHLEFTQPPDHVLVPTPTLEDLLVLYFAAPIPESLIERVLQNGGTRVTALNPYWEEWGVTIADPDGYRVVLCTRDWKPT